MHAVTVKANGPNKSRAMPVKNKMGTNTATMANVEANTGPAMALAAAFAASIAFDDDRDVNPCHRSHIAQDAAIRAQDFDLLQRGGDGG
jgi:hypothetical protein